MAHGLDGLELIFSDFLFGFNGTRIGRIGTNFSDFIFKKISFNPKKSVQSVCH